MTKKRRTVGLALGAGAARGTAHLGVLRAVRDLDIPVDFVAGTSIGSLVGGVFACGRIDRLEEALLNLDWKEILSNFLDLSFPRAGLVDGKRIVEFISEFIHPADIRELPIPFRAVATDIMTGREVVLSDGPLIEGIRASIAVPGVFTPVQRGEFVLVDGGLVNPVPVSVVRKMGAEFIIAVDINSGRVGEGLRRKDCALDQSESPSDPEIPHGVDVAWYARLKDSMHDRYDRVDRTIKDQINRVWRPDRGPNIFDVLGNTIRIMEAQIGESQLRITQPDVLIRPAVPDISFMEFNRTQEGIDAGYAAAYPLLESVKTRL